MNHKINTSVVKLQLNLNILYALLNIIQAIY